MHSPGGRSDRSAFDCTPSDANGVVNFVSIFALLAGSGRARVENAAALGTMFRTFHTTTIEITIDIAVMTFSAVDCVDRSRMRGTLQLVHTTVAVVWA